MLCRSGHFRQRLALVSPCHHMACTGDVDLCLKAIAFDVTRLQHLEKFGVQRTSIDLESKLGNFGANGRQLIFSIKKETADDSGKLQCNSL